MSRSKVVAVHVDPLTFPNKEAEAPKPQKKPAFQPQRVLAAAGDGFRRSRVLKALLQEQVPFRPAHILTPQGALLMKELSSLLL